MSELIEQLRLVPDLEVVTDPQDMAASLVDWRGRHSGQAKALLLPQTTKAVSAALRLCVQSDTAVFPQGGNTSVCGGSVPDESGNGVILNLRRMNKVRAVDPDDESVVVEAGCVLQEVQLAASEVGKLFPLSLGAEGSCQVGGNIATNAGGTGVVRYGNTRDLVLGLEVVLPDGTIWDGLRTLRKNNSGYDLKNLFVGSEGTLGVITAAALRLFSAPPHSLTALISSNDLHGMLSVAREIKSNFPDLSALEVISGSQMKIVLQHVPGSTIPLPSDAEWYLLVELSSFSDRDSLEGRMNDLLSEPISNEKLLDAAIASSERQRLSMWGVRHHVTEGNVKAGMGLTHDIAVPLAAIGTFVEQAKGWLAAETPEAVPVIVGHLGDGNLHYIAMFDHDTWNAVTDKPALTTRVNHALYDIAAELGGTFSAEHGIGSIHTHDMDRYKSTTELEMMRSIKALFDPRGIMNPGRVLGKWRGAEQDGPVSS